MWLMTEAQRESWKNEIAKNWVHYYQMIGIDGTARHRKQLLDMSQLGAMSILIGQEGGMGKSQLMLTHLKIWALLQMEKHGYLMPSVYWRKVKAREGIGGSPEGSAHGIDEDQDDSGTASGALVKQIRNLFKTGVRKPDRIVVYAGIDVDPSQLGNSVSLYLKPFGFNRKYQANRFIAYNNKKEPLWIAALQRCFLPHEKISYEGEVGVVGEYEARADEFSIKTDGIHSSREEESELFWRDALVKHWMGLYPKHKPKANQLSFEARQLQIPEPVQKVLDDIISSAQLEISILVDAGGKGYNPEPTINISSKGWECFRERLNHTAHKHGASERDAEALSLYFVPEVPLWSYKEVHEHLKLGRRPKPDSLGQQIKRRLADLPTKEIGDIGELCVMSWLDPLRPEGGAAIAGQPDILIPHQERLPEVALNVKTSLNDQYREYIPTTPEYDWRPYAFVVLLLPRLLEVRLFPISEPKQTINGGGGILTTTEKLADTLQEMIEENEP